MSWRPNILHPDKTYLHDAYGITEERRIELSDQIDQLSHADGQTRIISVHYRLDQLAGLARSKEEFTYMVFIHAWYLAKKNALL